jgi:glycosyltransferase involved in cell wall biosynthesis
VSDWGAQRIDQRPIGADDIVVMACVRNEALRLPWFLEHHRRLGVGRFLIVDNASADSTAALLDQQADVIRFYTAGSYAASRYGVDWINALAATYCEGRWVLTLDADELFYFPQCESRPLRDLTGYLERCGADACVAPLLDMYPAGPIEESDYRPGQDMLEAHPWFDATGYTTVEIDGLSYIYRGGPRQRAFWDGQELGHPSPVLLKIPLTRWSPTTRYTKSTHLLEGARLSRLSGVLLHFKLACDFAVRAAAEADRAEHFAGARQYAAYAAGMRRAAGLNLMASCSQRLRDSRQLVELGLMRQPEDF